MRSLSIANHDAERPYPLRTRWRIVTRRWRWTWRDWWEDLVYLLRG